MDAIPRLVERTLAERVRMMTAFVLTGARQTGKCTLAAECAGGVAMSAMCCLSAHSHSHPVRHCCSVLGQVFDCAAEGVCK
jgi:hypothetical protein